MSEADWDIREDAIVERPRSVTKHPLLTEIYDRHDQLISQFLPDGPSLEIAFGQYMHPEADIGLEAWPQNVRDVDRTAVVGDARSLPFDDESFDGVIGRRFLHHVPREHRRDILQETSRILKPDGTVILLEGTPGLFRRLTKGAAFRLGVLGDDSDVYGHLTRDRMYELVDSEFEVVAEQTLGSPFMLASISESELSKSLFPIYRRTQFVQWWMLVVGEVE